jgi:hypothetical protein
MSITSKRPPRRRAARLIRLGVLLVVFGAICGTLMTAFNIGVMHGAGTSVVAVAIYSVPATLFDWPRITLADFVELVCDIWRAIVGFFASLFDW